MKINITVDLRYPQEKYLSLRYDIPCDPSVDSLVLVFPTWSPGSYLIRDFQSNVEDFAVKTTQGKKLKWEKISKNEWRILTRNIKKLIVTYKIYANDLSVRGVYTDFEMGFFNAPAVFFHPKNQIKMPCTLKIKVPQKWQIAIAKKSKTGIYSFKNFDELYDTPLLASPHLSWHSFSVQKTHYRLAVFGPHHTDFKKVVRDLKKILTAQNKIFKDNPCQDYLFQIIFKKDDYGGLEHGCSSTNIFDGFLLNEKKSYYKFLTLLSHEHFHLWNVKRIRPRALGPFDYGQEIYTKELWIVEGITSFFDDHTAFRGGLFTGEEYLDVLTQTITNTENEKATRVNSLSESSFDAWIRFYRKDENMFNRTVNYYVKGGLVSLLLDLQIIKNSNTRYSLDDVMCDLYQLYKKRPELGITRDEFFDSVEKFLKFDRTQFIKNHIDGTQKIPWESVFKDFGIAFKNQDQEAPYYAGLIFEEKFGKVFIKQVAEDSPAFHSEIQAGDELLAINDLRIEKNNQLNPFLKHKKWRVLLHRFGKIHDCEFALDPSRSFRKMLVLKENPSKRQKRLLRKFLR